jgi:hypothetical protein
MTKIVAERELVKARWLRNEGVVSEGDDAGQGSDWDEGELNLPSKL